VSKPPLRGRSATPTQGNAAVRPPTLPKPPPR
jgi:hypothetical protein